MSGKCQSVNVGTEINVFKYQDLKIIDEMQQVNVDIIIQMFLN